MDGNSLVKEEKETEVCMALGTCAKVLPPCPALQVLPCSMCTLHETQDRQPFLALSHPSPGSWTQPSIASPWRILPVLRTQE